MNLLPFIGGRGVGNWEGDQPNFGGKWFLDPQGGEGTSSDFLRGKRGGGINDKTGKKLIAAERRPNFGNFEQK